MSKKDDDKILTILSYILIGIVWYFVDDKAQNKTTKFHVKQGIVLFACYLVCVIVANILFFLGPILWPLIQLAMLVFIIIGMYNAANKKQKELPLIGGFAKHLKF